MMTLKTACRVTRPLAAVVTGTTSPKVVEVITDALTYSILQNAPGTRDGKPRIP